MKNKIILSLIIVSFISVNVIAQKDAKTNKKDIADNNKTITNIKKIINSELQAFNFYTACSEKALKEGYPKIAQQFTAIAEMENSHYKKFKELIKKMKVEFKETKPQFVVLSTKDNVKTSYNLEEVAIKVYDRAIKQAQEDGSKEAEEDYKWANEMEKSHAQIFKNISENFDSYKEK